MKEGGTTAVGGRNHRFVVNAKMVKFGIIGCGVIGPYHARALEKVENAQLVAICDIDLQKAQTFAEKFGVDASCVYENYHDLLAREDIDAVCICVPSGLHGQLSMDALKAGKHVICEKPMEITKEKLDAVCDAYLKSGKKFACVFQRRTQPIPSKVKAALDSGIFGKPLMASAYLKYHRTAEYYKSAGWRATWEMDGGGSLMNQGVHGVDLISWFMGGIDKIYGVARTQFHDIPVEDAAVCTVKYKNGAIGIIESSTCVYPAQDTRFEIHCENGSIIFDDKGLIQWELKGGVKEEAEQKEEGISLKDNPQAIGPLSHLPIMQDFVDAIVYDREPMATPLEGRKAVDTILAIYKSSETQEEIQL